MSEKPSDDAPVTVKVEWTKAQAEATESYTLRCINCERKVFAVPHTESLCEGHIYSEFGQSEYRISKMCEWCFDKVTAEIEDEFEYLETEIMPSIPWPRSSDEEN